MFWIGVAIGWVGRMAYEAEANKDEKIIEDTLNRAYRAGWRSARDE
jgi:hypothetical protein